MKIFKRKKTTKRVSLFIIIYIIFLTRVRKSCFWAATTCFLKTLITASCYWCARDYIRYLAVKLLGVQYLIAFFFQLRRLLNSVSEAKSRIFSEKQNNRNNKTKTSTILYIDAIITIFSIINSKLLVLFIFNASRA